MTTAFAHRFRTVLLFAPAVALITATGCHDEVTGPNVISPTPTPTPLPATDLSGRWTGTTAERGLSDEYFCPPHGRPVEIDIAQIQGRVQFRLPAGYCTQREDILFDGVLSGYELDGELVRAATNDDCELRGHAEGTVDATHIDLDGGYSGSCNRIGVHLLLSR